MATLYFNGAVDGDWNTLGNWWDDSGFTTPASALPTSGDSVIASASISSITGGNQYPEIVDFTIGGSNYLGGIYLITITGTATFNDSSFLNGTQIHGGNSGPTGSVVFNDNSYNQGNINYKINTIFNDNSIHGAFAYNPNVATNTGSIGGDATFNDNSIKRGTVAGTITWNSSYPSNGGLTYYFNGAVDGDWNNLGNWWLNSGFTVPVTTLIGLPQNVDSVVASATISSNSGSAPTVVDFTINGSNQYLGITLTVTGIATFNDTTYNVGNITGEVEFNDSSANGQLGSIIGNVTFNDNSIHAPSANINGNATFNNSSIKRGSVTGIITWNSSYPSDGSLTYYFNGATDDDWNNTNNWWLDSGFTVPVTSTLIGLPQTIDSVIASATIGSNSGSNPTIVDFTVNGNISINIDLTVSGMATFNDASTMGQIVTSSKFINGNATFNNTSILLGTINGNATFNNSAICAVNSNVSTNATFNNNSIKRGTVTGIITWNSSYPSDYSLTYYYNNGSIDGDWATLGNWWLDSSFTVPINSGIGLPTNIDTTNIFANVSSNTGSTPTVKDLIVGDSSYANVSFDISINVNNSATFNNGAKFAYNGNNSLLLNENKTVTFNSNSECYGAINSIDGTSLVNIVIDSAFVGLAFAPWASLRGNIILQGSNPTISADATISSGSTLTINSGYFYYTFSPRVPTNFTNITIVVNNDRPLGPSSSYYDSNITSTMFSSCNITFNDTSYSSASLNINFCSLTFNDDSYNLAYYGDVQAYSSNNGSILNTYQFNNNSHNYGFIAANVTWNNGKGINGSSILGIV